MAYIEGEITGIRPASGRLAGKIAVITGSTSGIGRASAVLFGWEGAKVVVSGRRTERGEAVVKTIRDNGGEAIYVRADMTTEADMENLIQTTMDTYGRIDILFNNAGYMMNKPTLGNYAGGLGHVSQSGRVFVSAHDAADAADYGKAERRRHPQLHVARGGGH